LYLHEYVFALTIDANAFPLNYAKNRFSLRILCLLTICSLISHLFIGTIQQEMKWNYKNYCGINGITKLFSH
jgi:cell division septal protein FtsQ